MNSQALLQPPVAVLRDEPVVHQVRIAREHAIDLVHLAGAQLFVRIEAPPPGEQSLPPQHFVDAGNAPGEIVRRIEQGGVEADWGTVRHLAYGMNVKLVDVFRLTEELSGAE